MSAPARSSRAEVRNPVLALATVRQLRTALPLECRGVLAALLLEISMDARGRADQCWRKHKAPMAAYWKAVAVYTKHISRAMTALERRGAL